MILILGFGCQPRVSICPGCLRASFLGGDGTLRRDVAVCLLCPVILLFILCAVILPIILESTDKAAPEKIAASHLKTETDSL